MFAVKNLQNFFNRDFNDQAYFSISVSELDLKKLFKQSYKNIFRKTYKAISVSF